jgi:hypothetical protein
VGPGRTATRRASGRTSTRCRRGIASSSGQSSAHSTSC